MKKILSILIVSMLAVSVMAANEDAKKGVAETSTSMVATIKGKVVDKLTGEALAGVAVKLDENTVVYTDFDGNFSINLTRSKAKIYVSLISYATTEVEVKKSSNEVKIELNSVQ